MITSYKVVTFLVILMSLVHIGIAPVIFDEFTIRVGWFLGVGLMGVFLGFLNILFWRSGGKDLWTKRLCLSANIIALVYVLLVITVDHDPQGIIVVFLFAWLTFSSVCFGKKLNPVAK